MVLEEIFKRVQVPRKFAIEDLRGIPFEEWPADLRDEAWNWLGPIRRARPPSLRARPRPDPVPALYAFFTGDSEPRRFYFMGRKPLDVNPAHYSTPHFEYRPPRPRLRKPKPIDAIIDLMVGAQFWPTSVEQLLAKWPELSSYSREDLEATVEI